MMKKLTAILLLLLLLTIGILVGYQWFVYKLSDTHQTTGQNSPLETDIRVISKKGSLFVEQRISNFKEPSFLIKVPPEARDLQCSYENGQVCEYSNVEEVLQLPVEHQKSIYFTYTLAVETNKESLWVDEWFIQLATKDQQLLPMEFQVSLSEEDKSVTWIASGIEETQLTKEHLVYYVWNKGKSNQFSLYRTNETLYRYNELEPQLIIYAKEEQNWDFDQYQAWLDRFHTHAHLTVVMTPAQEHYSSTDLVIIPSETAVTAGEELMLTALLKQAIPPASASIEWLWEVLSALILERPVGTEKVYEMADELLQHLPVESRKVFIEWLVSYREVPYKVTTTDLDNRLSKSSSLTTSFFTVNRNIDNPLVPLYFTDNRDIQYEGKAINDGWFPTVRGQELELYFPLVKTLESLNFEVTFIAEEQLYIVARGGNSWRFYLDKIFYIYNQEDYGLMSKPLEQIAGNVFISETGLEQILKTEVIKREKDIYLRQMFNNGL